MLSSLPTTHRDMYFLEKLVGLGVDDGVAINTIFTDIFLAIGITCTTYAQLLLPTAKSGNKVSR